MYHYLATKGNVTQAVLKLKDNLLDFLDYGICVTEPKHRYSVYGWIQTEPEVSEDVLKSFELIAD